HLTGANSGGIHNAGGIIEATGAASVVQFAGNMSVDGGTLRTSGGGILQNLNQMTITDITLQGVLSVGASTSLFTNGSLNTMGEIILNSSSNTAEMVISSPTTLTGGGSITMQGSGASIRNSVLTNVDNLIHGQGALGNNSLSLSNQGVIQADVA